MKNLVTLCLSVFLLLSLSACTTTQFVEVQETTVINPSPSELVPIPSNIIQHSTVETIYP